MDVARAEGLGAALARLRLVRHAHFVVLHALSIAAVERQRQSTHEIVARLVRVDLVRRVATGVGRGRLLLALFIDVQTDPLLARVIGVAWLVWQSAHRHDAHRVRALTDVCDAHRVDESGKRLLQDVFDHLHQI